jgi:hypothetical protein
MALSDIVVLLILIYVESNRHFHPWQGNSILGDEVIKSSGTINPLATWLAVAFLRLANSLSRLYHILNRKDLLVVILRGVGV